MFAIEAMFIGRIGYAALAGQGMAIQLITVFLMILITFILGSSLIISRHLGANETREANHVFHIVLHKSNEGTVDDRNGSKGHNEG